MAKTAILVDGGFYRKRAAHLWGKKTAEERAKELNAYCMAHLHDKDGNEERQLYRIFYYDCEPVGRRSVYHPLTKKNVDLDKSDTYTWTQTFLEELRKRRKFALRLGTLSNQMSYNLRPDVTRKLLAGTKQLEELTGKKFDEKKFEQACANANRTARPGCGCAITCSTNPPLTAASICSTTWPT